MSDANKFATVQLDEPIHRGDQIIAELKIRKPGPGELRGLKLLDVVQAEVDAMITLLPRVTVPPLTEAEVIQLDLADFVECSNQVAGFFAAEGREHGLPDHVEDAIADVAAIFHWPLSAFDGLSLDELMGWRARAIERGQMLGLLKKD